ncbi:Mov34/MPN/PAD-1 family protein [Vibrio gangliei]|uniref:hypothetical protein n=1 Tax=Vibrio gangliei TaxID=2077090 RepID=UPI000D01CE07|nr:hypothetical protein [Vibrio gangliei]
MKKLQSKSGISNEAGFSNSNQANPNNVLSLEQRLFEKRLKDNGQALTTPVLVKEYLGTMQGIFTHDRFVMIALGEKNELIGSKAVKVTGYSFEGLNDFMKDSKVKFACLAHSSRLLQSDTKTHIQAINQKARAFLGTVDVTFLDHLIVCEKEIISLVERGHM